MFTDTESESEALKDIRNIMKDTSVALTKKLKSIVRNTVGAAGVETIKKIVGK